MPLTMKRFLATGKQALKGRLRNSGLVPALPNPIQMQTQLEFFFPTRSNPIFQQKSINQFEKKQKRITTSSHSSSHSSNKNEWKIQHKSKRITLVSIYIRA